MRALALAAVAALSLAACNETTSGTSGQQTLITQVMYLASRALPDGCQFLPTAETVANIIAKNNATVSSAEQIAEAICGAVKGSPAAASSATNPTMLLSSAAPSPAVLGVPVHGRFVGAP